MRVGNERSNGVNKIGLIAGSGKFPILFAQAAKDKGYGVVCVAIEGEADSSIDGYMDKLYWVRLGELSKLLSAFKQEGINKAVMAGQIKKVNIFDKSIQLDDHAKHLFASLKNGRDTNILSSLIKLLQSQGIDIVNSTTFLDEFLPQPGVLTKRVPTDSEKQDIEFGFPIAREVAGLDIGQTIVVKDRVVVSVEAVEGTDEAMKRAASLAGPGAVVIKVARPFQDMRFDIPVIGINTIKTLIEIGSNVIAVEAKKTLFIDEKSLIEFADLNNITIAAI